MSKFQAIVIGIFILCIVAGVIAFATYKGGSSSTSLPAITIWGTFPKNTFLAYVNKININRNEPLKVDYVFIPENVFDKVFIEALARGQGPDAILITQDLVYKHEDKIIPIPYTTLSERDYRSTFIQQGELYLLPELGSLALPFIIDPLIMYWNRDVFTNAGIAVFPKYWDEFSAIGERINQKDANSNIRKSVLAMGEFSNITNAREILGALFLQAGNTVTYRQADDLSIVSSIGGTNKNSSILATEFFTRFSDPRNPDYSWNRSLSNSKSSFLSGNLATYIGFASEIFDIRQKNPNIDFDIAQLPQARGSKNRVTYGSLYGFSIVRSSGNPGGVYSVLDLLLASDSLSEFVNISYLPPVKREMISRGSKDPYLSIFYDSALISKGWLDTNIYESTRIFKNMTESISSGRKTIEDAIQDASDEYDISLSNI
ncbi:MAG: extracellular solute-binding protein [Patescibacteria group bacterium]